MAQAEAICSGCGHRHEVRLYPLVNVRENPELKDAVRDGSLFVWECPDCGQKNLIRSQTLYHDPDGKLMVWLLPEGSVGGDGEKAMSATLSEMTGQLSGYTLRRVQDVGSLIEKVNIHDAGLEDTVMEICKYVTRMQLAENDRENAPAIMQAPFKFFRLEGADNKLIFSFPLRGKMQGVPVGFSIYEDCAGILSRNPSVRPDDGFAKVDSDWVARFFR